MRLVLKQAGAALALAALALVVIGCVPEYNSQPNETKPAVEVKQSAKNDSNVAVKKEAETAVTDNQPNAAKADGEWGTVKGTITYKQGEKLPDNPEANITADKAFCLSKGKITQDEWVVDEKSRGIKWVLVWLSDVKTPQKAEWDEKLIHPDLKKVPEKLVLDQPVCTFIPRMTALREGTKLIYKNSATVAHNVRITGGDLGPEINQLIPPGRDMEVGSVKARFLPFSYSCTIHPWMRGWLASFNHPYSAVTNDKGEFEIKNAPAGKFRLQIWHEGYGFVQKSKTDRGKVVTIEANKTAEVKEELVKE